MKRFWGVVLIAGLLAANPLSAPAASHKNLGPVEGGVPEMRTITAPGGPGIRLSGQGDQGPGLPTVTAWDGPAPSSPDQPEELRIIVELDDQSVLERVNRRNVRSGRMSVNQIESMRDQLRQSQSAVKEELAEQAPEIEYHYDFVNVMNGFSATVAAADIETIEGLPGVKKVYLAQWYEAPVLQPNLVNSKGIIKAHPTWNLGYKGEGRAVAIIDTCLDPLHQDMRLSDAVYMKFSPAEAENIIGAEGLPGRWFSDKVPYGYNYADDNDDISSPEPHGMHVAGIVAANTADDDEIAGIRGVAPEAQLLAMKVSSNDPDESGGAWSDVIIRGLEDATMMGADVLNLSLGTSADFVRMDDLMYDTLQRVMASGVVAAFSAGNSNRMGDGYMDPYSWNPDIGVVGSPGSFPSTIQVASLDNNIMCKTIQAGTGRFPYQPSGGEVSSIAGCVYGVDCGLGGTDADFGGPDADLTGKIALIKRGGYNFVDKIMNAQNHRADGVIVYNHESGGEALVVMQYPAGGTIPAVFIGNQGGEILRARIAGGENQFIFTDAEVAVTGEMSDFTSWGATPELDFKPDITAPGGNIYSTVPDNGYEVMSGTSMASPHVAGGAALVLQMMDTEPARFSGYTGTDRANMVKNLLMSTAHPQEVTPGVEVSPRRQGAGVMDLYAATTTPAIVTDPETGLSKANLREIGDNAGFTIRATNLGDEPLTYEVSGTTLTAYPYIYHGVPYINTSKEQAVLDPANHWEMPITFSADEITVPAGGTAEVEVSLDLTAAACAVEDQDRGGSFYASLDEVFPNGTFVEGFIRLKDPEDHEPELGLPYMGFYGEWDQAPVLDDSIYDPHGYPYYGLFYNDVVYATCLASSNTILGLDFHGYPDADWIAISPNGDGEQDEAFLIAELLRNAREIDVDIMDDEGRQKLRDLDYADYVIKNYNLDCSPLAMGLWDGKVNETVAEDGEYIYRVRSRIDGEDSAWQTMDFPVRVDTRPPIMELPAYDEPNGTITVQAHDFDPDGGPLEVFYMLYNDPRGAVLYSEDGNFDLDDLTDIPFSVQVVAQDMAGNRTFSNPIILGADTVKPEVHFISPEARGIYNQGQLLIKGYVLEDNLLASLTVNGEDIDFSYNDQQGRYLFEDTLTLTDGPHDLRFEAVDGAGNTSAFQRRVYIDAIRPQISATWPDATVPAATESVTVAATVNENMSNLEVYLNGNLLFRNAVSVDSPGFINPVRYEMPPQTIALAYGDNRISLRAVDGAGNVTVQEFTVNRPQQDGGPSGPGGGGVGPVAPVPGGSSFTAEPGQEQSFSLEGVRVTAPAGAVGEEVQISINRLPSVSNLPQPQRLLSGVYEFTKDKSGAFLRPLEIRIAFNRAGIDRNTQTPVMCWLDEIRRQWVEVEGGQVDWEGGTVTGGVDHFTKFAVLIKELPPAVPVPALSDIKGHWAQAAIEKLVGKQAIGGYADGSFRPDNRISRAEFCTMLVKCLALESDPGRGTGSFTDIAGHWARPYIEAAYQAGIIQGYDASAFGPDDPLTREQVAVMLAKALRIQASAQPAGFSDAAQISFWARPLVSGAVQEKMIGGYPDGSFKPQGQTTRAEAVSLMVRGTP